MGKMLKVICNDCGVECTESYYDIDACKFNGRKSADDGSDSYYNFTFCYDCFQKIVKQHNLQQGRN